MHVCRTEVEEARQAAEAATTEAARRAVAMEAQLEAAATAAADAELRAAEAVVRMTCPPALLCSLMPICCALGALHNLTLYGD